MISAADLEFHPCDRADRIWTETTYLAFNVPQAALHGTLYVMARPNLGVAMSSVVIARGVRRRLHEMDFCDPQIHLPCPPSFSNFALDNGLSVRAQSLRHWQFAYRHQLGACAFELELQGLHHPHDPLDPMENPLLTPQGAAAADPRVGDAWSHGHFDLKGRIRGELTLHGQRYAVDCFEGMDRSWGPRNETPNRATAYISANFGEELGLWLTMTLAVSDDGSIAYDRVNSGFVVEAGVVTPIVAATVQATTADMLAISDHIVATDVHGRRFELFGAAIGTRPLGSFNPSIAAFQSLMRYQWGQRLGHGGHGKLFGLSYLAQRLPRGGA